MRFVDMFMTALGSLIFIAMLLVFLLPKAAQPSVDPTMDPKVLAAELAKAEWNLDKANKELTAAKETNENLQDRLAKLGELSKDVVKRWLSVKLLTKNCPRFQPTLYVRWEGDIEDFVTGKSLGKMTAFDASNPIEERLVGDRYVSMAPPSPGAWQNAATWYTIVGGVGPFSIYIALRDPRSLARSECVAYAIIHGSSGEIFDSVINLSLAQPFAWVGRVHLEKEGAVTSVQPEKDTVFLRELEEFSDKESKKLCEKKLICGTQDAHWARYATPPPPLPEAMDWRPAYRFTSQADRYDVRSPMTVAECEKACIDDPHCTAVEHDADDRTCALYDVRPLVSGVPGSRWKVGTRTPSPLDWKVDHTVERGKVYRSLAETSREECGKACLNDASCSAVEYYKPTRACNMFRSIPKILPSPIGAFAPTDVGVKTTKR